jgi:hypothetical protein
MVEGRWGIGYIWGVSVLNFKGQNPQRLSNKKKRILALSIGALGSVIALGSTLAASINLNSATPVEFGQGVAQTTACDKNILITPNGKFVNSSLGNFNGFTRKVGAESDYTFEVGSISNLFVGQAISSPSLGRGNLITAISPTSSVDESDDYPDFPSPTTVWTISFSGGNAYGGPTDETMTFGGSGFLLSSFTLSNIDSTECSGKKFTIKTYGSESNPLATYVVNDGGTEFTSTDGTISNSDFTDPTNSSVKLNLSPATLLSTGIIQLTVESSSDSQASYEDSLTNGRPSWLVENIGNEDLDYSFTGNGMSFTGNANNTIFPYVTGFEIPSNKKTTVEFVFNQEDCSDQGLVFFNSSTDQPRWIWGTGVGLSAKWNCGGPQIDTPEDSLSNQGEEFLAIGFEYIGIFTYDPSRQSNNLSLVTKSLDGTVLDTISTTAFLSPGNYKIGFSADQDNGSSISYFKNLAITIE